MGGFVRRYIDFFILLIPTPLVLAHFAVASLLLCSFSNVFFFLFMLFLCNVANIVQRTFKIVQKSKSWQYSHIDKHIDYESRDFHMRGAE